jgi:endoribonuclease Dicer
MGPDLWDKQTWDRYFEENMVIVCTAEILNQCLLSSYVKIRQINLLIFDEAHHTKKDHPYARSVALSRIEPVSDLGLVLSGIPTWRKCLLIDQGYSE